jgi:putative thioredoxin
MLSQGEVDVGKRLLENLVNPEVIKHARVIQLLAHAKILQLSTSGEDEASLSANIAVDGNNLEARLKLANVLVTSQRYAAGMDQLLEIVQRDRKFQEDIGRKTLLDVFNLLGGQGELVSAYRRKLSGFLN